MFQFVAGALACSDRKRSHLPEADQARAAVHFFDVGADEIGIPSARQT
jgi:hypothetical protein